MLTFPFIFVVLFLQKKHFLRSLAIGHATLKPPRTAYCLGCHFLPCPSVHDEWMALAEGLGLTSEEIRFLDKRTLNPMEAALSFIAKQRFLSVSELYELLNERDFLMLADLL